MTWTEQPPPSEIVLVGNFPPTEEEKAIDPKGSYGQHWGIVQEIHREWQWANDHDALEREMTRPADAPQRVNPGPRTRTKGSKLTKPQFWMLISKVLLNKGDTKAAVKPLIAALGELKPADIQEFQELLAERLYQLDGEQFAAHAGQCGTSDDGFLYARCFVVASGQAFFEKVRRAPKTFPKDVSLEVLLTAAEEAHLQSAGESLAAVTHFSYETGSNPAGWSQTR